MDLHLEPHVAGWMHPCSQGNQSNRCIRPKVVGGLAKARMWLLVGGEKIPDEVYGGHLVHYAY